MSNPTTTSHETSLTHDDDPRRRTTASVLVEIATWIATPILVYVLFTALDVVLMLVTRAIHVSWLDRMNEDVDGTWWSITASINRVIPEMFVWHI